MGEDRPACRVVEAMSHGWKLAVLKRRREHLSKRLAALKASGASGVSTKHDQREHDALDWAIEVLDPMVPPS